MTEGSADQTDFAFAAVVTGKPAWLSDLSMVQAAKVPMTTSAAVTLAAMVTQYPQHRFEVLPWQDTTWLVMFRTDKEIE